MLISSATQYFQGSPEGNQHLSSELIIPHLLASFYATDKESLLKLAGLTTAYELFDWVQYSRHSRHKISGP